MMYNREVRDGLIDMGSLPLLPFQKSLDRSWRDDFCVVDDGPVVGMDDNGRKHKGRTAKRLGPSKVPTPTGFSSDEWVIRWQDSEGMKAYFISSAVGPLERIVGQSDLKKDSPLMDEWAFSFPPDWSDKEARDEVYRYFRVIRRRVEFRQWIVNEYDETINC